MMIQESAKLVPQSAADSPISSHGVLVCVRISIIPPPAGMFSENEVMGVTSVMVPHSLHTKFVRKDEPSSSPSSEAESSKGVP